MFDICARYQSRIEQSRQRLKSVWERKNERPAVIINDVNYWLGGWNDLPDNYFQPEVMFAYQAAKIEQHMAQIDDDYIPVFHPWYGTGVVPSALGSSIKYQKGMDPVAEGIVITCVEDIAKLRKPDPYRDGQMPLVLRCIDYFVEHTDASVTVTDCQGPLNIALTLAGVENLFVWMYEEPDAVHELLAFCTEALIEWVTVQKKHAGHKQDGDAYPHAIYLPEGYGGVAFSDDDIVALSAPLYREFVVPCNERVLNAFGGGTIHFCGSAEHQIQNLSQTKHCTGINNFCMENFEQVRKLQAAFSSKGAVMACDFSAGDIDDYCKRMMRTYSDPTGLIVGIFPSPTMELCGGKYNASAASRDEIVSRYLQALKPWMK